MSMPETYPLTHAAFVLREPIGEVRRTVERRHVELIPMAHGDREVRSIDLKTLVFLAWWNEHRAEINPALWSKLYSNLKTHHTLPKYIRHGTHTISLQEAISQVRERLRKLHRIEKGVSDNQRGDLVIKGTDIEVYRIAALLDGGMSIDEVLRDYPSLNKDQVVTAEAYAAANPKPGRPYPKTTAKAAMNSIDLSGLELD